MAETALGRPGNQNGQLRPIAANCDLAQNQSMAKGKGKAAAGQKALTSAVMAVVASRRQLAVLRARTGCCLLVHLHRRDAGHGHVRSRGRRTVGQSRVGQSPIFPRSWRTSGSVGRSECFSALQPLWKIHV